MANGLPRKVIVNERAAKRLRDGHVWVYASDVLNDAGAKLGAMVHVIGPKDKILGSAIYSSSSQIKLRLLGRDALRSEEELLQLVRQRLAEAVAYRSKVVQNSDACRLVFSEADRLPGLIIDRYNDVFTLQVLTQSWAAPERKQAIIGGLKEFAEAENIVERAYARIRDLEQLPEMESGMIEGGKSSTVFTMNGVNFHYDALGGQKTGAFLDQRENYAAAAEYARGEALDVCTYQGGFALHLARGCDKVTAVDISR
ncbi:MAG: SAM-dependent methyltransferase, partial [Candidatus Angelobacter sp.]